MLELALMTIGCNLLKYQSGFRIKRGAKLQTKQFKINTSNSLTLCLERRKNRCLKSHRSRLSLGLRRRRGVTFNPNLFSKEKGILRYSRWHCPYRMLINLIRTIRGFIALWNKGKNNKSSVGQRLQLLLFRESHFLKNLIRWGNLFSCSNTTI